MASPDDGFMSLEGPGIFTVDPQFYEGAPDGWGSMETFLFGRLAEYNNGIQDDEYVKHWYDTAYFHMGHLNPEEIDQLQSDLSRYLWDEYGIEFDHQFDWAIYREWYSETG